MSKRTLSTCVAALAVTLALPAALTPSALGARPLPGDARARLVSCVRAVEQPQRALTAEGVMRTVAGAQRMHMRFDLYRRLGRRVLRVAGPGLGVWNASSAGVRRYRFRKRIENLPAPGGYYVRVAYRWTDAQGGVVARAQRHTGTCVQPDQRPVLRVDGFAIERLGGGRWRYAITVMNGGRSAAGDFDVALTVDGVAQPAVTVDALPSAGVQLVAIEAPRCRGEVAVTLDPDGRVGESSERNNRRQVPCGP